VRGCHSIGPTVACMLVLAGDVACCAQSSQPPSSPFTVITVRERHAGEVSFEELSGYLRRSPDRNYVPGPDSLVAQVTIVERRGYIEILNVQTGKVRRLLMGFLPQWSPDGKYLSCLVWKSVIKHGELTIVNVATGNVVVEPEVGAGGGAEQKWSPDSRKIAVSGGIHASPRRLLYTVSVPDGHVTVLDSTDVLAGYNLSWSPDSRWLVFTRPTELDDMDEDPVAADLWMADAETGRTWILLETPEWMESDPQWISSTTIQVTRAARRGGELGVRQTVVVELSNSTRKVPPRPE